MKSGPKFSTDTEFIEPMKIKVPEPQRVAVSKLGMVATAHFLATEAGVRLLEAGGNAFDAAVAAAFALSVCEPQASGLGGQTMMLLHHASESRTFALDGSSRVPSRAAVDHFTDPEIRFTGHRATTVPSTPATLGYLLERYGSMSLGDILEPAIRIAVDGYPITLLQRRLQRREKENFDKGNIGALFLKGGEKSFAVGDIFTQPVLARTLKTLARNGIEDFYLGQIAGLIDRDMQAHDGLIRLDDLARIPYPVEREVQTGRYQDMQIRTMPLPAGGRTLIEMLNIIAQFPAKMRNPDTPEGALLVVETIRRARLDRQEKAFDPDNHCPDQARRILTPAYAREAAAGISRRMEGRGETTHLSVMDRHGNVVALTQSIERVYGAKVAGPELGFIYNNYMSDFEFEDENHPYYLRPNAVPWANVAPTIIFKKGKPWLAIGSPGSDRITSAIMQVLIRMSRLTPFEAVAAPRLHCSLDGKVSLEAAHLRDDIPAMLEERGYELDRRRAMSFYLGCIQLVRAENGEFVGVADPRRDGSAAGPKR